jgi:hypothetical protein
MQNAGSDSERRGRGRAGDDESDGQQRVSRHRPCPFVHSLLFASVTAPKKTGTRPAAQMSMVSRAVLTQRSCLRNREKERRGGQDSSGAESSSAKSGGDGQRGVPFTAAVRPSPSARFTSLHAACAIGLCHWLAGCRALPPLRCAAAASAHALGRVGIHRDGWLAEGEELSWSVTAEQREEEERRERAESGGGWSINGLAEWLFGMARGQNEKGKLNGRPRKAPFQSRADPINDEGLAQRTTHTKGKCTNWTFVHEQS